MISYATIKEVRQEYAVCQVEKICIFDSKVENPGKECYTVEIPLEMFQDKKRAISNNIVYTVEHNQDKEKVDKVIRFEPLETTRRLEWMISLGIKSV